jgi:DNA-binding NtrC family response regulator
MARVLVSWIGNSDLYGARDGYPPDNPGPLWRMVQAEPFERIHLLSDFSEEETRRVADALRGQLPEGAELVVHDAGGPLRNNYALAYERTRGFLVEIQRDEGAGAELSLLLSPGLPAMQVAMIVAWQSVLLGKARLFNAWKEGVEEARVPFSLEADVLPRVWPLIRAARSVEPDEKAFAAVAGTSAAIQEARRQAQRVARFAVPVLLLGESGTGKELLARAIHDAGPRRGGRFVPLNCGGIPSTLAESLLFGHVAGAFTDAKRDRPGAVEDANKGTLFLDEVGEMPHELQVKLLRFLNDGSYSRLGSTELRRADVRVIAATNRPLAAMVQEGRFRLDLHERLDGKTIPLPPLWRRREDIGLLARAELARFCRENGLELTLGDEAVRALSALRYPGNVRTLLNLVRRLAMESDGPEITEADVHREADLGGAFPGRPLCELDERDFVTHLAACLDELLARWNDEGGLPVVRQESEEGADLLERVIWPLLWGRAMLRTGDNASEAGRQFQFHRGDASPKKAGGARLKRYEETWRWGINERRAAELRGR